MQQKLMDILNSVLRKKEMKELKSINKEIKLRDDLNFDSLELAELTVKIEDEFGIDIFSDGLVYTIGDILNKLL